MTGHSDRTHPSIVSHFITKVQVVIRATFYIEYERDQPADWVTLDFRNESFFHIFNYRENIL